jgi:hypothetical protein
MTARPSPFPGRFLRSSRGVSAIEFAFVAPVFFMLVVGIFDIGALLFLIMSVESATLNAARYGSTGALIPDVTRDARVREIIEERTLGLLDDKKLKIDTLIYDDFDAVATAEWLFDLNGNGLLDPGETFDDVDGDGVWDGDPGVSGAGGPDAVVVYRVSAEYRMVTPVIGSAIGPIPIRAAAPIRNEPF